MSALRKVEPLEGAVVILLLLLVVGFGGGVADTGAPGLVIALVLTLAVLVAWIAVITRWARQR